MPFTSALAEVTEELQERSPGPQRATEPWASQPPAPSPAPGHPALHFSFRTQQGRASAAPVPGPPTGSWWPADQQAHSPAAGRGRAPREGEGRAPAQSLEPLPRGPGRSGGATRTLSCTGSDPKGDASLGVHRLTFWSLASLFSLGSRPGQECLSARMWPDRVCKMRRCLCTDC